MRGQRLPDPLKSYTPPVKEGPSSEKEWALQGVTIKTMLRQASENTPDEQ